MADSTKIRNLVDPDGKSETCWQEVLLAAVELSGPLRDLEYSSKKSDLAKAKRIFKEVEKKMKVFKVRLGKELTREIESIHSIKSKSYKGNPDSLVKFRKNQ